METLQRDKTLDIAKGICIILMVIGHSGCPTYLHDFIYMFHMPCFFFISGWLLNDRYITDLKTGLIQKAKGSYYPFVKWTLIFLLFHNVLEQLFMANIHGTYRKGFYDDRQRTTVGRILVSYLFVLGFDYFSPISKYAF